MASRRAADICWRFVLAWLQERHMRFGRRYARRPLQPDPDFGVTSVNYDLPDLLARTEEPA